MTKSSKNVHEEQDTGQGKRTSPRKPAAVIKLKVPERPKVEEVKPLKLTLKLSKSSSDEAAAAKPETKITPKLTLSLRRPQSTETNKEDEILDVVAPLDVSKKRGRKLKSGQSHDTVPDTKPLLQKKTKAESAPVSLAASRSLAGSTSSVSSQQQPQPSNKPSYTIPVYSEEDRQARQIVNGLVQDKVTLLQSHRDLWDAPVASPDDLIEALWPFYEELAVTELTHSGLYRQAALPTKPDDALQTRHAEEYDALKTRFQNLCLSEKNKSVKTELILLEHRLCLEEEKFLYTKLKNDYYTNYANMGGKPSSAHR